MTVTFVALRSWDRPTPNRRGIGGMLELLPPLAGVALVMLLAAAEPLAAQQSDIQRDLRASQLKLDSIQAERQRLEREMETLRTRVRDASRELVNIERQQQASRSALMELEFQTELLNENV